MLVRPRPALEVLSISALDLFASALGVFVLIAIILFPYYLREPSVEAQLEGARAELSAAGHSVTEAEQQVEQAQRQKALATAALAQARERLQRAEAAADAATENPDRAEVRAPVVDTGEGQRGEQDAVLSINDLDLVFVMDTTGSMRAEIKALQASLLGVINILHRLSPRLRVGFVAYRDKGDAYLTRDFPLSRMEGTNVQSLLGFVRKLSAAGGGDRPEPVDEALRVALDMEWRADAQGRIIVIGDAPAHAAGWQRALDLANEFRRSASASDLPRAVSAILTGSHASAEAFFERLASAGRGEFTRHQGEMIESVLLSVLRDPGETRAGR